MTTKAKWDIAYEFFGGANPVMVWHEIHCRETSDSIVKIAIGKHSSGLMEAAERNGFEKKDPRTRNFAVIVNVNLRENDEEKIIKSLSEYLDRQDGDNIGQTVMQDCLIVGLDQMDDAFEALEEIKEYIETEI